MLLAIDAAAMTLALASEQVTLVLAGRAHRHLERPSVG